jgi:hypothetical protein
VCRATRHLPSWRQRAYQAGRDSGGVADRYREDREAIGKRIAPPERGVTRTRCTTIRT